MSFEELGMTILVFTFAMVSYCAGKGNLLELVPLLISEMLEELQNRINERGSER